MVGINAVRTYFDAHEITNDGLLCSGNNPADSYTNIFLIVLPLRQFCWKTVATSRLENSSIFLLLFMYFERKRLGLFSMECLEHLSTCVARYYPEHYV